MKMLFFIMSNLETQYHDQLYFHKVDCGIWGVNVTPYWDPAHMILWEIIRLANVSLVCQW